MSRIAREQATAEKALVASERQRVIYERKVAQLEVILAPHPPLPPELYSVFEGRLDLYPKP
jgi:hypothetical protein